MEIVLDFLESLPRIYPKIFLRYAFFATLCFVIFYVIFKKRWAYKKIQSKFPKHKDYIREVSYSVASVLMFSLMAFTIFRSPLTPYSQIYYDLNEMPSWYYYITFFLMLITHDTYFYWMHRAMHHPRIYRHAHLVHHKSTNPSPWAAYSFHPIEAFFEAAILPIMAFAFPIHISIFGIFFLFQIIYNVYGHLGYEIYPKGFHKHWLGKWINTSVHHNLHHKNFHGSYGLYFTFWDRIMGTMANQYDETFEQLKERQPESIQRTT